jgi:hypothetical protein
MYLADGEFIEVAVNREESLKLRGGTRIPIVAKGDGQHLNMNIQK